MVNVTSEEPGVGAGVLLRALEPLEGAYNRQESIGKSSFKRFRRIAFMYPQTEPTPRRRLSTESTV
jgi:3-methyladenine DNA glycosylase Mpg